MNKQTPVAVAFCLALLLFVRMASAASAPAEDLVKADWSLNATHNLASNPPSLEAVQNFYDRAFNSCTNCIKVCEFRFADLRNSGNLSLIMTADSGGRQSPECDQLEIFDKTPTGFELYAGGAYGRDLAHSVLDLNHDGRNELVLWSRLARYATSSRYHDGLGCSAEWPLIFAWTGSTYSDVSDQYKDYYRDYLKTANARLVAYTSALAPAAETAKPFRMAGGAPSAGQANTKHPIGGAAENFLVSPVGVAPPPSPEGVATPAWAARNEAGTNYVCTQIEVAKAEAFLSIDSDSTINAAIKDSETNDPNKRIAAAVVFSFLRTPEAEQDLKTLSNDADPRVAGIAKRAASFGEDPPADARTMRRENTYINLTEPPPPKP